MRNKQNKMCHMDFYKSSCSIILKYIQVHTWTKVKKIKFNAK